jgi:phosphate transport system substrate-binding protein
MTRLYTMPFLVLLLPALGCAGRAGSTPHAQLTGKGSTFVYPLMVHWANLYERREEGCKLDYQPLGSGSGIKAIINNKVAFACTDAPQR